MATADISEEELAVLRKAVGTHGRLIFAMVAGSASFNLATPTSDRDLFGVYLANERGPLQQQPSSFDSHNPDYAIYEVSKFAELLSKGNPKLVEPLYTERLCWTAPEWDLVKGIRRVALNLVTVKQYLAYSIQKLTSAKSPKVATKTQPATSPQKDLYHALRLAKEALLIASGKPPVVFWEGGEREELMKIRRGEVDLEAVMAQIQRLHLSIEAEMGKKLVPKSMDKAVVNNWAVKLKLIALAEAKPEVFAIETTSKEQSGYQNALRETAESILHDNHKVGKVLFCAPYGRSLLSDEPSVSETADFFGVFVIPTSRQLSVFDDSALTSSSSTVPISSASSPDGRIIISPKNSLCKATDRIRRGFQLIELEAFLGDYVLKGNHVMTEGLFLQQSKTYVSDAWTAFCRELGSNPFQKMLNMSHTMHYLGNAESLFSNRSTGEAAKKNRRLGFRMLVQARKLVVNRVPDINFSEDELKIITGEKEFEVTEAVLEEIKALKAKAKEVAELQKVTDVKHRVNQVLLSVRAMNIVS